MQMQDLFFIESSHLISEFLSHHLVGKKKGVFVHKSYTYTHRTKYAKGTRDSGSRSPAFW